MKALLLGGSGFIGSHLIDLLGANNFTVKVFDREPEKFRTAISGVDYVLRISRTRQHWLKHLRVLMLYST